MPTLLIMRHAKAAGDSPDGSDHARPLTQRGRDDAARMGHRVAAAHSLDAVVSSTATRAIETAEQVAGVCKLATIETTPKLYHASVTDWAEVVAGFDPDRQAILAVAHNPGVGDLLHRLGGDGFAPTATVGVVELDDWTDLSAGRLVDVLHPS